jgi:hypothetical protein
MSNPTEQSKWPLTDAAELTMAKWRRRCDAATSRGSHLGSDDPKPADGWETARRFELVLNALAEALRCTFQNCNNLHHDKKDRHEFSEPCPVEARIQKALSEFEKLKL